MNDALATAATTDARPPPTQQTQPATKPTTPTKPTIPRGSMGGGLGGGVVRLDGAVGLGSGRGQWGRRSGKMK